MKHAQCNAKAYIEPAGDVERTQVCMILCVAPHTDIGADSTQESTSGQMCAFRMIRCRPEES